MTSHQENQNNFLSPPDYITSQINDPSQGIDLYLVYIACQTNLYDELALCTSIFLASNGFGYIRPSDSANNKLIENGKIASSIYKQLY